MRRIWKVIRPIIRGAYRILGGLNGFIYDFRRFVSYGGWYEDLKETELRNYNSAMAYHGLEKSLSYKKRNPKSGWGNAERVFLRLQIAAKEGEFGYHDKASKQVLLKFLSLPENADLPRARTMIQFLNTIDIESKDEHGAILRDLGEYKKGQLKDPESFFLSRYSLREFKDDTVDEKLLRRAITLALKTPSVCNRQAWHVYHSNHRQTIDKALFYQNGNKPFGERIPNLFIITTNLKAFFAGAEHYQHWIDGGLFSMSVMYALHSLGIASCPLNWSQTPKKDKALRKALNIKPHHTVIMMMAVGYPDDVNIVCSSTRRPVTEVISQLELK